MVDCSPQAGATCVLVVQAFGVTVAVIRRSEHRHLYLEAVMSDSDGRVFRADAGTADPAVAEENARGFAAALAVETVPIPADGPRLIRPTYKQLEEEIRRRGRDVDGLRSRLRLFMNTFGFDGDRQIGPELSEELTHYRGEFRRELMRQGKSAATIGPYLSKLTKLADIAGVITVLEGSGLTFGAMIRMAAERAGTTIADLARAVDFSRPTLQGWVAGKCLPSRGSRAILPALEKELKLPHGALTKLIGGLRPLAPNRERKGAFPFARALREALRTRGLSACELARWIKVPHQTVQNWVDGSAVPGAINRKTKVPLVEERLCLSPGTLASLLPSLREAGYGWSFTAEQIKEFDALKAHKTNTTPANRSTKAGSFWKVYEDGTCPTADFVYNTIRCFYGYLALPQSATDPRFCGLGKHGASLSLLDLAIPEQIEAFVNFQALRSAYNSSTVSFLVWVRSLLRRKTGYFWQAHGVAWQTFPAKSLLLSDDETPNGTLQQWRSHCERMVEWIGEWLEDLSDSITQTRDYSHIQAILDLDRPMEALRCLMQRMEEDYRATSGYLSPLSRAIRTRDLLYVSMLVRNPLRKKHWLQLTWRADGSGQLRKRVDGNYELFILKKYFKSLAGFRDENYLALVDPALTWLIDRYLTECRELLVGAGDCDYVFRPSPVAGRTITNQSLKNSAWLPAIVARFIPEYAPRGFSPHAVRHIVATHLMRTREDGIDRAADALHNTRAMIIKTYGHLRGRDLTAKAQRIIWEELED